ncbi:MAG: transposase [Deltaproteobacteria bacterium]|nr:transposase [Deltaproteobacteria bacterium]
MPTTRALIDRLITDNQMRIICGWSSKGSVPSESTFSRAFAEFSEAQLVERIHSALIDNYLSDQLIGHISRDSTEIEAREKPQKKSQVDVTEAKPKRKPGRPKKGEEVIKEKNRLERQQDMTLEQMLDDLPKICDVGSKRNSKGYKETWTGYKLHIDAADGQIPVSCVLSSASVHDSQVALPLKVMTHLMFGILALAADQLIRLVI